MKWISVEEKRPDIGADIFLIDVESTAFAAGLVLENGHIECPQCADIFEINIFTHWAPAVPPKEDKP
jgi:hypothetical protein